MLMKKVFAAVVLIKLLFLSCTSVIDGVLFDDKEKVALNCLLSTANDTVIAWLTHTAPLIGENYFEPVVNASVRLHENGRWIGSFTNNDSSAYILPYKVKPGAKYKIEVSTGKRDLWAETVVPAGSEVSFTAIRGEYRLEGISIEIADHLREENFYWLTAIEHATHYNQGKTNRIACGIQSNSLLFDDFNRILVQGSDYKFEFDYFARLDDKTFIGTTNSLIVLPICVNPPMDMLVISADYHLDKYLKTAMSRYRMDLFSEDFPVLYTPFPIYSNVMNGAGIFGAMNVHKATFLPNK